MQELVNWTDFKLSATASYSTMSKSIAFQIKLPPQERVVAEQTRRSRNIKVHKHGTNQSA